MSDTAIRAQHLGKLYRIGQGRHDTLRETLTRTMSSPFRALMSAANRRDALESDSETARREQRSSSIWALRDACFEIKKGEAVGIIGPNGSGKSTLLKLLAQITEPTAGEIRINGRVTALIELGAGFHPELTGKENIYLTGAILGMTREEIEARFEQIVEFAGLPDFIDTPVKHYSSGMYVRLGFAAAACSNPEILLVDEVLAVGDGLFQAKCLANFQHLKEQGKTIVLVTHNLDLITTRCSRALLIDGGMIVDDGASKSVVDRYNRLVLSGSRANRGLIRESAAGAFQTEASSKGLQWQGLFTINPNEDRYGPGTAEILEAGIFTPNDAPVQVLQRNRDYFIKVKVRHNDSMQAAVTAFSIKDLKGTILCGTNTSYQKIDMGWMDKGEVVVVTFKQFLRLNSGEFLLSLGCGAFHGGDYVVYDRRFDYLSFQVVGEEPRVGLFDPESTIEWSRAG